MLKSQLGFVNRILTSSAVSISYDGIHLSSKIISHPRTSVVKNKNVAGERVFLPDYGDEYDPGTAIAHSLGKDQGSPATCIPLSLTSVLSKEIQHGI